MFTASKDCRRCSTTNVWFATLCQNFWPAQYFWFHFLAYLDFLWIYCGHMRNVRSHPFFSLLLQFYSKSITFIPRNTKTDAKLNINRLNPNTTSNTNAMVCCGWWSALESWYFIISVDTAQMYNQMQIQIPIQRYTELKYRSNGWLLGGGVMQFKADIPSLVLTQPLPPCFHRK